jgi:hypothetical protein
MPNPKGQAEHRVNECRKEAAMNSAVNRIGVDFDLPRIARCPRRDVERQAEGPEKRYAAQQPGR